MTNNKYVNILLTLTFSLQKLPSYTLKLIMFIMTGKILLSCLSALCIQLGMHISTVSGMERYNNKTSSSNSTLRSNTDTSQWSIQATDSRARPQRQIENADAEQLEQYVMSKYSDRRANRKQERRQHHEQIEQNDASSENVFYDEEDQLVKNMGHLMLQDKRAKGKATTQNKPAFVPDESWPQNACDEDQASQIPAYNNQYYNIENQIEDIQDPLSRTYASAEERDHYFANMHAQDSSFAKTQQHKKNMQNINKEYERKMKEINNEHTHNTLDAIKKLEASTTGLIHAISNTGHQPDHIPSSATNRFTDFAQSNMVNNNRIQPLSHDLQTDQYNQSYDHDYKQSQVLYQQRQEKLKPSYYESQTRKKDVGIINTMPTATLSYSYSNSSKPGYTATIGTTNYIDDVYNNYPKLQAAPYTTTFTNHNTFGILPTTTPSYCPYSISSKPAYTEAIGTTNYIDEYNKEAYDDYNEEHCYNNDCSDQDQDDNEEEYNDPASYDRLTIHPLTADANDDYNNDHCYDDNYDYRDEYDNEEEYNDQQDDRFEEQE